MSAQIGKEPRHVLTWHCDVVVRLRRLLRKRQLYPRHAKTHGPDQVARIAASIAEFGWTVPVLVGDEGEVIAGHGRILAAEQLGLDKVPVIVLGHLSEAQRRAYRIADNRLTEPGGWDDALLATELKELLAEDFDLALTGVEDGELDRLLREGEAGGEGESQRFGEDRGSFPSERRDLRAEGPRFRLRLSGRTGANSSGLSFIKALTRHMNGQFIARNDNGAVCSVAFRA